MGGGRSYDSVHRRTTSTKTMNAWSYTLFLFIFSYINHMFNIIKRISIDSGTSFSHKISKEVCPAFFAT